jgi:hypothetical protein
MRCHGLDSSVSGRGPVDGSCEHGNKHSVSTKCWEILGKLRGWHFLKKDSAPWSYLVNKLYLSI